MREELFEELLESIKQGGAILRGEMKPSRVFEYNQLDVRSIRSRCGFSQTKFADLFGVSVAILRNWEQGRSKPEGAASILLRIAAKYPNAVLEIVNETHSGANKKNGRASYPAKKKVRRNGRARTNAQKPRRNAMPSL